MYMQSNIIITIKLSGQGTWKLASFFPIQSVELNNANNGHFLKQQNCCDALQAKHPQDFQ